jgi:hypothetical protein
MKSVNFDSALWMLRPEQAVHCIQLPIAFSPFLPIGLLLSRRFVFDGFDNRLGRQVYDG